MANLFGKTLLSLVAACVAHGVTFAQGSVQETFSEAVRLLRTKQPDQALEKLREVLAADPSNEDAYATWKQINEDHGIYAWELLLSKGGEYERITRFLMDRATLARQELSKDDAAIAALIAKSGDSDFAVRNAANAELAANHGEFAVPALLTILGDSDAGARQDYAMLSILRIGRPAVLPLIEALKSDNGLLRRNAASALVHIGDARAIAPLAQLTSDPNSGVRAVADAGLREFKVAPGASATSLYLKDATAYMAGPDASRLDATSVVWTWSPVANNVVAHEIPSSLYAFELAKMRAQDALHIDPANTEAQGVVASAYLAQAKAIETNVDEPGMSDLAGSVDRLRMVAAAFGSDATARAATEASLPKDVVIELIKELGRYDGGDSIRGMALADALDSADTGVRFAAALSLSQQADSGAVPAADKVVHVLGEAVTEEALKAILVIDGNPLTKRAIVDASETRGVAIRGVETAKEGVAAFYTFPEYDVVIVAEGVADPDAGTVMSMIRKRQPETKILLLAQSEDAESKFEGMMDGVIRPEGEITGAALLTDVDLSSFDARRERANVVARAAGDALTQLAQANVNILAAADAAAKQLDRDDAVAIPAANALGAGGTLAQASALAKTISAEANAERLELRTAAADALGGILSRSASVPADVLDALMKVAADDTVDAGLRAAAVRALGAGKLDAGTRVKLADILRAIPEVSGD